MGPGIVSRIAPTPSGYLHLGNGLNFVLTYLICRTEQGKLILRIDDLDQQRMRMEYLEDIFHVLDQLGIEWEQGPQGVEDHLKNHSQLHRLPSYQALLEQLLPHTFVCNCSRRKIRRQSEDGQYPGTCRNKKLSYKENITALRIITNKNIFNWEDLLAGNVSLNLWERMRDFVIKKKDGMPAYQLASLSDDLEMGVNLFVRGKDLMASTAAQQYLDQLLGNHSFAAHSFLHHPLLTSPKGVKLSKSRQAFSLRRFFEEKGSEQYFQWMCRLWNMPEKVPTLHRMEKMVREMGTDNFLKLLRKPGPDWKSPL